MLTCPTQANQSTFILNHGSILTSGDGQVGVWASGLNTTVHVSDVSIENKDTNIAFGLVAVREAVVLADLLQYSSDAPGTCAFVADGGEITIHSSLAHTRGDGSAIFCTLGGGETLAQIHAQEVAAVSENGPAVVFSGSTYLAAFTNVTVSAGGPAAIISTSVPGGLLPATILRVTGSRFTATGPNSPVLLSTLRSIDAIFYQSELVASASNILVHAACSAAAEAGGCTPFDAALVISESSVVGDVQA